MAKNGKSPLLGIICLLITATLLATGLWPFNFIPGNKVGWLENRNGIQFYGLGIVYGQEPLIVQKSAASDVSITIELLIHPYEEYSNRLPSILTLSSDNQPRQFMFGQWKNELIIRIPDVSANVRTQYRERAIGNALIKKTTHLITVISSKDKTDVYINGTLARHFPHYSLIPDDQVLAGRLILGNSSEGTHPWRGALLGTAIYDHALNSKEALDHYLAWQKSGRTLLSGEKKPIALYLFDEHGGEQIRDHSGFRNNLLIPTSFHPLRRIILGLPAKDQWFSRWNLMDIIVNILGFAPFGFFLSAWLKQVKNLPAPRVYGLSILIGSFLSIAIELIQVYLPTRDSSLLDVCSNILGTTAGALLLKYALPILHKVKGDYSLFFE